MTHEIQAEDTTASQARLRRRCHRDNVAAAKQQALEAAQTATKAVSAGAILGFFALLLGAVAAWFGGSYGTKKALLLAETTTRRTI